MRSLLEALCFLWMVLVVMFYNVSGLFGSGPVLGDRCLRQ